MNINVEETIKKFGYDPNTLKENSSKLVVWFCSDCLIEKDKRFDSAKRIKLCLKCSNKINANTNLDVRAKKTSEYFKTHDHPLKGTKRPQNVIDALRKSAKERVMSEERKQELSILYSGEGNPFFGKNHTSETIEKLKVFQKNNVRKGSDCNFYGKIYHGKGSWYICKDGAKVWMRSSWEIKFAEYLDAGNIDWLYEPKTFPIVYGNKKGTYTPDFYKIYEDIYYEIKGWWRDDAKIKYEAFCQQYPNIQIILLQKSDLIGLKIIK